MRLCPRPQRTDHTRFAAESPCTSASLGSREATSSTHPLTLTGELCDIDSDHSNNGDAEDDVDDVRQVLESGEQRPEVFLCAEEEPAQTEQEDRV